MMHKGGGAHQLVHAIFELLPTSLPGPQRRQLELQAGEQSRAEQGG